MVSKTKLQHSIDYKQVDLNEVDSSTLNDNKFIDLLLYGNYKFDDKKNLSILTSTIKLIKDSQRFYEQLL